MNTECVVCKKKLTRMNTPLFNKGTLKDGNVICTSCIFRLVRKFGSGFKIPQLTTEELLKKIENDDEITHHKKLVTLPKDKNADNDESARTKPNIKERKPTTATKGCLLIFVILAGIGLLINRIESCNKINAEKERQDAIVKEESTIKKSNDPIILDNSVKQISDIELKKSFSLQYKFEFERRKFSHDYAQSNDPKGVFANSSTFTAKYFSDIGNKITNWSGKLNSKSEKGFEIKSKLIDFEISYELREGQGEELNSIAKYLLKNLNVGEQVIFSGLVKQDNEKGIFEYSVTHHGSMERPEYYIGLTNIQRNERIDLLAAEQSKYAKLIEKSNNLKEKSQNINKEVQNTISEHQKESNPGKYLSSYLKSHFSAKIKSCSVNNENVKIVWYAESYYLAQGKTPKTIADAFFSEILRQIKNSRVSFRDIDISLVTNLVDAYGNASEDEIMNLYFNEATLSRINWNCIECVDLIRIADRKYISNVFKTK
jgi:hypothetical protein